MNRRTLSLKREALSALTTDELGDVAGATHGGCALTPAVTHLSVDVACPSNPLMDCLDTLQLACVMNR